MNLVPEESCADRLRELYPAMVGTTLIRLRTRDKRPIDSGWNVQAVENFTNRIDPGPIIESIASHVDGGGNVGWAIPPGVLVLDADNAESAAWVAETFPDAPRQRTMKGCHVVVREPDGVDLRQVTSLEIVDGISVDLRTSGRGQIAVEPSVHPSGFLYSWEIELPLDLENLPEIPPVLVERLKTKEETQGPVDISAATWREGSRETRLVSMAGRLRNMSLSESEIRATLAALNEERCAPKLSERDLARIARSAGKWDQGQDPTTGDAFIASAAPYELVPFSDLKASFSTDYLVKGLLDRGSMGVMYGQSGSSKSFCALELSMAIASGQKWRGQRVRKGKVAYIAAEGARGIQNRLVAMRDRLALGNLEAIEFYLVTKVVSLTDGNDIPKFVEAVHSQVGDHVELVVIDTLSRSLAGKDENSAADMTAAIAQADGLRQALGCAVLIVHHSGKNEALGARGHSSLRAALETELEVKRHENGAYSLTATKQREHEDGTAWWHELEVIELGQDAEGDPVTTCLVRPIDGDPGVNRIGNVRLNANEQRTHEAIHAIVSGSADFVTGDQEAVLKADLRQWVEENCGVPTELRRGVVRKGLEGLKNKGLVGIEGEKVFLMKESDFK